MGILEIRQFIHTFIWSLFSSLVLLNAFMLSINLYLCSFSHFYIQIVKGSSINYVGVFPSLIVIFILFTISIAIKNYFVRNYKKMWHWSLMLFVLCFMISIILKMSRENFALSQCVVLFK